MSDEPQQSRVSPLTTVSIVAVCLLFLLHIPLILVLTEQALFGTNYAYQACGKLGLNEFLKWIYRPIGRLIALFI